MKKATFGAVFGVFLVRICKTRKKAPKISTIFRQLEQKNTYFMRNLLIYNKIKFLFFLLKNCCFYQNLSYLCIVNNKHKQQKQRQ